MAKSTKSKKGAGKHADAKAKGAGKVPGKGSAKGPDKGADTEDVKVASSFTEALRVGADFDLASLDTRSTPAYSGDKASAGEEMTALAERAAKLQEMLYAQGLNGSPTRVLLVIQGMDTSGKGGVMRHVIGAIDPQGVQITAFKAPTKEELAHPFLWRIRRALPKPGYIGVFDRSHYEDVLIVRVRNLVERRIWGRRYAQINNFERKLVADDTVVIKVMLHISSQEQKERLGERLERPDKYWKFNPGDIAERELWPAYQEAYQAAVTKCSTDEAPWFVVPADRKWYARLAVLSLLVEHLEALNLTWPPADFDVEANKEALAQT